MKKTTLKKIIGAVRELEIKKSKNDSQFEFYNKKKHRIERKEKRMIEEASNKEALEYYKKNKETLDLCYGRTIILDDYIKYIESHLTKKTITKKFSIDDFKKSINWDIKIPEQEAQDNATTENELNELKNKIEKLISDYNQECKKLTINQDSYKYMYMKQD